MLGKVRISFTNMFLMGRRRGWMDEKQQGGPDWSEFVERL